MLATTSPEVQESTTLFSLHGCRKCGKEFKFILDGKDTVSVVAGLPPSEDPYVAISYVWGNATPLPIQCQNCSTETTFPMANAAKFRRILELGQEKGRIWLDSLSIDQQDHADVARQVAVMGDIYKNAAYVGVLLPSGDKEAFSMLAAAASASTIILLQKEAFARNEEDNTLGFPMGLICQRFFANIISLERCLSSLSYWSRAWTFQEWAMAADLCITLDSPGADTFRAVKSSIVNAALMLATYKMRNGQYAHIDVGFSRGSVGPRLQVIKNLFPYEDAFLAESELNEENLRFQTVIPHFDIDQVLGLRKGPPRSVDAQLRARLEIMLNAYGLNERTAKFEADRVYCWASMCGVGYEYDKNDPFIVALRKVVGEIRRRGVTLFNFVVDEGDPRIDPCFLDYAAAHTQEGARDPLRLPGTPVLCGVMDTVRHVRNVVRTSAMRSKVEERVARGGSCVGLRAVIGARVESLTALSNVDEVVDRFGALIPRFVDDVFGQWGDPRKGIVQILSDLEQAGRADDYVLIVAAIPIEVADRPEVRQFFLWAICSARHATSELFVAREDLNGTLVLAAKQGDDGRMAGYLVFTDQMSGSRLIQVDTQGNIDVKFAHRMRSDLLNSTELSDRGFRGIITLSHDSSVAVGH